MKPSFTSGSGFTKRITDSSGDEVFSGDPHHVLMQADADEESDEAGLPFSKGPTYLLEISKIT